MNSEEYLVKMKKIYIHLLNFIESDENTDQSFHYLKSFLQKHNIQDNKHDLFLLLRIITEIYNNHFREPSLFDKIERILKYFTNDIQKNFTKTEILNIFKSNKRLLLFFFEEKILIMNEIVIKTIFDDDDYLLYFAPEIKPLLNESWIQKYEVKPDDFPILDIPGMIKLSFDVIKKNSWIEKIKRGLPENFSYNRKSGENENVICELIRKDLVKEFIVYVNKNNIPLNLTIEHSIFETNQFLNIEHRALKPLKLIEYAAFFGSIEIFQYLRLNNVKITSNLFFYAIHGKNAEIIHILEENLEEPDEESYNKYFLEAIKCHHNDIADYFMNKGHDINKINFQCLKYYNFSFISNDLINKSSFVDLCKYDYYDLANFVLNKYEIDINETTGDYVNNV